MNDLAANPTLWFTFIALFLIAGAVNILRGLHITGGKRHSRFTLAISCLLFAVSSAAFRYLSERVGFGLALVGGLFIVIAAVLRMSQEK